MKKRILSAILALVLALSLVPVTASASYYVDSGNCGENLFWYLDSSGRLKITGSGDMWHFDGTDPVSTPWYRYRKDITSVQLSEGLTSIGGAAFYECSNLTSITIPASVTRLGAQSFYSCTSLSSITIPNKVSRIPFGAFYYCTNLSRVVFPTNLTEISQEAFAFCTSLKSIRLPAKLQKISNIAFFRCQGLTSVTIPNSVTYLGERSFDGCSNLTSVVISNNVEVIRAGAFRNCSSLTDVTLPSGLRILHPRAFQSCTALSSIVLPPKVTRIDLMAFRGCTGLREITIPTSVTSIGGAAFYECSSLETVYYLGTKTQWKDISIVGDVTYFEGDDTITIPDSNRVLYGKVLYKQLCAYGHSPVKVATRKATLTANGYRSHYECKVCGKWFTNAACTNETTKSQRLIPAVSSPKLSTTRYPYDGTVKRPSVTVVDAKGTKLVKDTDYTVSYASGRKAVGKYTVTIKGMGDYSFTKTLSFQIVPQGTTITSLTPREEAFRVAWEKRTSQVTGYELQYSRKSDFSGGVKTVTIAKNISTAKIVNHLLAGRSYFVRVRTCKTVSGVKYYSPWSAVKGVRTK